MTTWKLNQPWTWLLRTVVLWTACTWGCWAADAPVPSTNFNQFIYVDEAQQLDIQTIQQASFVPLDGAPKLNFAHSVVWLKLEETQTIDDHRNWYMKFLPAMVTQATVYTASEFNPNEWDATTWTANELALPIPLSANPSQGAVYVRLLSPWNFRLNLIIDSKDKIDLVQRRIDMFVIMITTMITVMAGMAIRPHRSCGRSRCLCWLWC